MNPLGSFTVAFLSPLTGSANSSLSIQQQKTVVVAGFAVGCLIVYLACKSSCSLQMKDLFLKSLSPCDKQEKPTGSVSGEWSDGFNGAAGGVEASQLETLPESPKKAEEEENQNRPMNIQIPPEFEGLQREDVTPSIQEPDPLVLQEKLNKKGGDQSPFSEVSSFEVIVSDSSCFPAKQDRVSALEKFYKKVWLSLPFWG